MPPPSQQDRSEATRAALVSQARRLFAERGFSAVAADEIVAAAGVTRGALHHHFINKRGVFQAVFEELEAEIATDLAALVLEGRDDLLQRALSAFLDICERPEVLRIALIDAPGVLGWATWREIESRHALGLLTLLLTEAGEAYAVASPEVLAQLVLGAVIEGAMLVAHADDPSLARRRVEVALTEAFAGLLP